jgi:DNA-binding CsgD family transcriptional regulator
MAFILDARDLDRLMASEAYVTDGQYGDWAVAPAPILHHRQMSRQMLFGAGTVNTASDLFTRETYGDWLQLIGNQMGMQDMATALHTDPDGLGVALAGQLGEPMRLRRRARRVWSRVVAHMGAAYRLRRCLTPEDAKRPFERVEAVIGTNGRLQHAEGPATKTTARDALRRAAMRADKARTKKVRSDSSGALDMWRALIAGRWSLVDVFDSDGRRYWVARSNAPNATDPRALTERERRVVTFAAMGHSQKLIGYELGVSPATVSRTLHASLRKLKLDNRMELSRFLFELWRDRPGDDPSSG